MMKPNAIYIEKFCERRAARVCCLSLAIFSILFCAAGSVSAQKRIPNRLRKAKVLRVKLPVKNPIDDVAKNGKTDGAVNKNVAAITVVNRAEADYLTGEASVSVNPKQPMSSPRASRGRYRSLWSSVP